MTCSRPSAAAFLFNLEHHTAVLRRGFGLQQFVKFALPSSKDRASAAITNDHPLTRMAQEGVRMSLLQWRDNALVAAHLLGKPLHSPRDLFSIFQEGDSGVVNHSSSLHHLAQLFRLRKLAGLLQDIPLQKNDEFIGVRGVAEKLSTSGPIRLAGDTVGIKRKLPLFIVRHVLSD
jgi:hypothetical protein